MGDTRRIVLVTGTRADYGKLHPLITALESRDSFETHIFATGMHLLEKFGETVREIQREHEQIYLYNNQAFADSMDITVANTITGLACYVNELDPDMIVVHGDRPETLAGAIVGGLTNRLTSHIEGGEISGTADEMIRHAVSKLSHIHFVANQLASDRLIKMGENPQSVFVVGSPDIDLMLSDSLPELGVVKEHYQISFKDYGIAVYHPVSTEIDTQSQRTKIFIDALIASDQNYIVVQPNNDPGSATIREQIADRLTRDGRVRVFPSIRFRHFLTLLKNAKFVIGNSSLGVREAPIYAVPTINLGTRQQNRATAPTILNVPESTNLILDAIRSITDRHFQKSEPILEFGQGDSVKKMMKILEDKATWTISKQKQLNL